MDGQGDFYNYTKTKWRHNIVNDTNVYLYTYVGVPGLPWGLGDLTLGCEDFGRLLLLVWEPGRESGLFETPVLAGCLNPGIGAGASYRK